MRHWAPPAGVELQSCLALMITVGFSPRKHTEQSTGVGLRMVWRSRMLCFCKWGYFVSGGAFATGVPLESLLARGDTWSGLTDDRVVAAAETVVQKSGVIEH